MMARSKRETMSRKDRCVRYWYDRVKVALARTLPGTSAPAVRT